MWACDPALTSEVLSSYNAMGPLFVQTLQSFLAAQCALAGDHLWPPDATESVIEDPHYDFIIVGAGSAGSVVANRLSEVPHWKVLLVEAGGNPSLATEIPHIFYSNMGTHQDWGYKSEPQESACRGYKQNGCAWPRGKTLGGSGSINGMFYVRGNKLDYDEWAANGNIGWNYEDVLKYFKKSENFIEPLSDDNKKFHGINGYLTVQRNGTKHWFEELILKAVAEVGIKELDDINGPSQMGAVVTHSNIKDGKRHSTAKAFLSVFKDRPNLHVLKNAYVTKILFHPKSTTVSGILIQKKGREIAVHARKEVILSAGTVNTPHLLLLSGIGPKEHLESLDIEVKADLAVGENLQDHVFFPVLFTMPSKENLNTLSSITTEFMEYISSNKGILSDLSPHRIIAFVNQSDPLSVSPEVQFHFLVYPPKLSNLIDILGKHNVNEDIWGKFQKLNDNNFIIFMYNVLLKPKSKGRIILKSKDPNVYPLIYANYFDDPEDLQILINTTKKFILPLEKSKAFKDNGVKLSWLDLIDCRDFEKSSDEYLKCVAKIFTFSLYHPTGTAKMGPDNDQTAVVDPELRVRKVQALRVIDASIMPSVVRGNTNAASIMIGEKGASMVKKFWLKQHTEL